MEVIDVAVVVLDVMVELPLLELVLVIELGLRVWVDLGSEVKTMKAGSLGMVSVPLFKPRCEITSANGSETVDCKVASQLKDTERKDLFQSFLHFFALFLSTSWI